MSDCLFDSENLVDSNILEDLPDPARPQNFDLRDRPGGPKPDVQPDVIRALIAGRVVDFAHLQNAGCLHADGGAEAELVAGRAFRPDFKPVVLGNPTIPEQHGATSQARDRDIEEAVVVEVGHRQPAPDARVLQRASGQGGDAFS
jgi:hypothetical protein